jgi:hypothetical protein
VLPNRGNIGYETVRSVVLDEVNGMKIHRIDDVMTALKSPVNGFQVFKFDPGGAIREAVLDASEMDSANEEIMRRFNIPADHYLATSVAQTGGAPAANLPVSAR